MWREEDRDAESPKLITPREEIMNLLRELSVLYLYDWLMLVALFWKGDWVLFNATTRAELLINFEESYSYLMNHIYN